MGLVQDSSVSKTIQTNSTAVWSSPQVIAVLTLSGISLFAFLVHGKSGLAGFDRCMLTQAQNTSLAMTTMPIRLI